MVCKHFKFVPSCGWTSWNLKTTLVSIFPKNIAIMEFSLLHIDCGATKQFDDFFKGNNFSLSLCYVIQLNSCYIWNFLMYKLTPIWYHGWLHRLELFDVLIHVVSPLKLKTTPSSLPLEILAYWDYQVGPTGTVWGHHKPWQAFRPRHCKKRWNSLGIMT